mmetsp:Transcript_41350/g.108646  ORF Transcript_41350/g.108646 Transcript_41350/m.108646 type:complete len:1107 (-) Transcript_41350:128-3448(-)
MLVVPDLCPEWHDRGVPLSAEIIQDWVEDGVDLEKTDGFGWTLLMFAASTGELPLVQALVGAKAAVDAQESRDGATAVALAARGGHGPVVRALALAGASLTLSNSHGWLPMTWAAMYGQHEAIRALLKSKARVDHRDHEGMTPLHWASRHAHQEAIQMLLTLGRADARVRDNAGRTPAQTMEEEATLAAHLQVAEQLNDRLLSCAQMNDLVGLESVLVEGAMVDAADETGMTALMWTTLSGRLDMLALLLRAGARTDIRDATGHTAADFAVQHTGPVKQQISSTLDANEELLSQCRVGGSLEGVREALRLGACVETLDDRQWTPLLWASWTGNTSIVQELLLARADAQYTDVEGWTCIHSCAAQGKVGPMSLLVKAKASLTARTLAGEDPALTAVGKDQPEGLAWLLAAKVSPKQGRQHSLLWVAARDARTHALRCLLDTGSELAERDDEGVSVLAIVCSRVQAPSLTTILRWVAGVSKPQDEPPWGFDPRHKRLLAPALNFWRTEAARETNRRVSLLPEPADDDKEGAGGEEQPQADIKLPRPRPLQTYANFLYSYQEEYGMLARHAEKPAPPSPALRSGASACESGGQEPGRSGTRSSFQTSDSAETTGSEGGEEAGDDNVIRHRLGLLAAAMDQADRAGRRPLAAVVVSPDEVGTGTGRAGIVRALCLLEADPNHAEPDGSTAIHHAARLGRSDLLELLLAAGGDLRTPAKDGSTAFDVASGESAELTKSMLRPREVKEVQEVDRLWVMVTNVHHEVDALQLLDHLELELNLQVEELRLVSNNIGTPANYGYGFLKFKDISSFRRAFRLPPLRKYMLRGRSLNFVGGAAAQTTPAGELCVLRNADTDPFYGRVERPPPAFTPETAQRKKSPPPRSGVVRDREQAVQALMYPTSSPEPRLTGSELSAVAAFRVAMEDIPFATFSAAMRRLHDVSKATAVVATQTANKTFLAEMEKTGIPEDIVHGFFRVLGDIKNWQSWLDRMIEVLNSAQVVRASFQRRLSPEAQTILLKLQSQILTKLRFNSIKDFCAALDLGDDELDSEELGVVMRQVGIDTSDAELLFQAVDLDASGAVSAAELSAALHIIPPSNSGRARRATSRRRTIK